MAKKPKEPEEQTNLEEQDSEEFKRFEKGLNDILSLSPKEIERVKKAVPHTSSKKKKQKRKGR